MSKQQGATDQQIFEEIVELLDEIEEEFDDSEDFFGNMLELLDGVKNDEVKRSAAVEVEKYPDTIEVEDNLDIDENEEVEDELKEGLDIVRVEDNLNMSENEEVEDEMEREVDIDEYEELSEEPIHQIENEERPQVNRRVVKETILDRWIRYEAEEQLFIILLNE